VATTTQGSSFDRLKQSGKKFLAEWKEGTPSGTGRDRRSGTGSERPHGDVGEMLAR
jgi:hypothetical protein